MAVIMPKESRNRLAQVLVEYQLATNLLRLYVNDLTPTDTTVVGNVTECSSMWYMARTMSFGTSGSTMSGDGYATIASVTWYGDDWSDPVTVYGWYILNSYDGKLLLIERFATPKLMASSSDSITVNVRLDLTQGMF